MLLAGIPVSWRIVRRRKRQAQNPFAETFGQTAQGRADVVGADVDLNQAEAAGVGPGAFEAASNSPSVRTS